MDKEAIYHLLTFLTWYHLVYFGLFLPLAAVVMRNRLRDKVATLNRARHFRSTAVSLTILLLTSLIVARVREIPLFPASPPPWTAVVAGVAMYAVSVSLALPLWRKAVRANEPVATLFMPTTSAECAWWLLIAALAGVGEEITWRGVQVTLLEDLSGSYWLAVLASATSFALMHAVQGWKSVLIIGTFAIALQALVGLAGSLYVAMAVHTAYDLTAGLVYGRLARQFGYSPGQADVQPS